MKTKLKIAFLFVSVGVSSLFGQLKEYEKKIPLSGITEKWHSIRLPETIFSDINDDFSDIRIYGETATDTLQAPYLLDVSAEKKVQTPIEFNLINQVSNTKGQYYTFQLKEPLTIDRIGLHFANTNFDWKINLEGSNDQSEWFTILEDYRILSVRNKDTDYKFTDLNFANSKYRYFRVLIKTNDALTLVDSKVYTRKKRPAKYVNYEVSEYEKREEGESTIIEIDLKKRVPVSLVQLHIDSTISYKRPVTLSYLSDSVQTEKGWQYRYRNVLSTTLSSDTKNNFTFNTVLTQKLRLVITNRDNEALYINNAEVKGYEYHLIARFTKPANYYLVYGNENADFPKYDIEDLVSIKLSEAPLLSLGKEEIIPKTPQVKNAPLFENKIWLWAIMGLTIVVLGGFTFKMMQKKA
ncbi:DUF3999 family protein [Maribacter sp. 2210JD10-5]|uniref:DUF3999 family protein n=1 Tax=Maribacter sp. 2210JD10-5 TaxID=3386272 RepID=UPI0039BCC7B9